MPTDEQSYHELCAYTLAHGGKEFVHQHVVDAYMAQHADERTKSIGITFALVGLYLHLAGNFTGREVQLVHMQLARGAHDWPEVHLPAQRGHLSAIDVVRAPEGPARDRAIDEWCASVWAEYRDAEPAVLALLERHDIRHPPRISRTS